MKLKLLANVSALALIAVSSVAVAQGQDRREPDGGGKSPQGESRGDGGQQAPRGPARGQGGGAESRGGEERTQQRNQGGGGEQRAQQRGGDDGDRRQGGARSERSEQQRGDQQRGESRRERSEGQQQRSERRERAEEQRQRAQQSEDSGTRERAKSEANEQRSEEQRRQRAERREERKRAQAEQREERKRAQAEREEQRKTKAAEDAQQKGQQKSATPGETKKGDERQRPAEKSAQPKGGTTEQQKQQQQQRQTEQQQPGATPGAVQPGQQDRNRADRADRGQGRLNLTGEQRTRLRETVVRNRPERVTNIDVRINVGQRLPRRVSLYPIPDVLVSTYPVYRDYRYVVVRDEICIVDPATYEIVEVIDYTEASGEVASSSGPREGTRSEPRSQQQRRADRVDFTISNSEQRRIYTLISQQYRPADLNFRLGLGVEIPDTITLLEFPAEVVEIEPKLRNYRFVYAEEQVLVVERDSRDIVLLIRN